MKDVLFIQNVPVPYFGSLGLGMRPAEDYFAGPANVAAKIRYRSVLLSVEEMKFDRTTATALLDPRIEVLSTSRLGALRFFLKHRGRYFFYANARSPVSFLGVLFCKRSVLISHDAEPPHSWWRRLVFRAFANRFTYHRVNNPYERQALLSMGVRPQKIVEIPLVIDVDFYGKLPKGDFRKKYGVPRTARVLVFVANLRAHKQPIDVIRALPSLPDDVVLVHVGDDYLSRSGLDPIVESAKKYGVAHKVFAQGHRTPEEVREILSFASVYVHPTAREGQCLAVYEAVAAGLPLCLSAIGSFTSVFSGAALFHEPGDHRGLAENIRALLSDKKKARILVATAAKVLPRVTEKRVNGQLERLFREVVE